VRCAATPLRPLVWWLYALTLAAAALLNVDAEGAEPAVVAPTAAPAAIEPVYRVVIASPPALAPVIERSVGLVRWQTFADMTLELMERLARDAQAEAREAAAAMGFFSAQVEVATDYSAKPAMVTLTVIPGEPTTIAGVNIDVTGPAVTDTPLGTAAIASMRENWSLPRGDVFRQAAWTAAKARALAALRASPYAAAAIASSEALIDPDARTAELSLAVASGPAFRFGDLDIQGLDRYSPSLVRNYSAFERGDPYTEAALHRLIRRLNASGYFSSVQAAIDPDTAHPDDATVRIAVIEGPTRQVEAGFGYSTDVNYSARFHYRDVNVNGNALQMLVDGELDSKIQSGSLRFTQPANAAGWLATWGLGAKRTDIEGLITRTAIAGTRWRTLEEERERALSATYYLDDQHPADAPPQQSHAVYVEGEQYWREVDQLIAPTRGWMASAQLGGGIPGISTRSFGRVIGRAAAWVPLDGAHELAFRAEAGAVLAPSRDGIPSTLLFRTGGDTTVRGYAFESLGVPQGNAVVGGRYYAVASAEAIRWIGESWGLAAFVDAGNAVDSLPDFQFAVGYGVGARVRTPLGPFRFDLAYGQQVHEVRIHFSVGLSF
jgi:translocation and assembly module TamA